jgi:hypothetical protein
VIARRPSASNTSLGSSSVTCTIESEVIDTFSRVRPFFFSSSESVAWIISANSFRWAWRLMNVWFAATLRSASVSLPSMSSAIACSSRLRSPKLRAAAEHVLRQRLDLDVELRRDVRLDLVRRDERVLARSAPPRASPLRSETRSSW